MIRVVLLIICVTALSAVAVGLAQALAAILQAQPITATAAPVTKSAIRSGTRSFTIPAHSQRPLSAYDEIVNRPVFFEGRRYPKPQPAVTRAPVIAHAPPKAVPPPALGVRGVLIEQRVRRALITNPSGRSDWLATGDVMDGWRVVSIDNAGVVVNQDGHEYVLGLHEAKPRPVMGNPVQ